MRGLARIPLCVALALLTAGTASPESERQRTIERAKKLTKRPGEHRPEDQLTLFVYERPLIIGGEVELEGRFRRDYRLDPDRDDDEARLAPKLELEAFYALGRDLSLFVKGKLGYQSDVYHEAGEEESEWRFRRGETWLHWRDIAETGLSFQVGRQNFADRREWWWDADLDALRLTYDIADFEFQLGVAQELGPEQANESRVAAELEDVFFLLGSATWHWEKKNRLELFVARRRDHSHTHREGEIVREDREDKFDAKLWWIGARAMGRWKTKRAGLFHYWVDLAYVRGKETIIDFDGFDERPGRSEVDEAVDVDVSAWGFDVGATWDPRRRFWPRLTLGYAWGSGGGDPEGTDRSFRQTGLQDNNAKYRGVDRFKYYGELFRPELSNLHITTASLGFPLFRNSSIEVLYHVYWQDHKSTFLREARIKAGPQGEHRSLGQEWNLVIGIEEWTHWEVEVIGALFRAGAAFGSSEHDLAQLGLFKINYNF